MDNSEKLEYRRLVIDKFNESDLKASEYCESNDLIKSTFYGWKCKVDEAGDDISLVRFPCRRTKL